MTVQNIHLWALRRLITATPTAMAAKNSVSLNTSKSYTFRRLNEATSHPFYLSDTGHNKKLL